MAGSKLRFKIGLQLINEDPDQPKVIGLTGICQEEIHKDLPANLKDLEVPQLQMIVDDLVDELQERLIQVLRTQALYRKTG